MIYVQLYNDGGLKIDEVEVRDDQSILDAIANSGWYLDPGDTLKIVEEDGEVVNEVKDKKELIEYMNSNRYATEQDAIDDLMWAFGFSRELATNCANEYFEEVK